MQPFPRFRNRLVSCLDGLWSFAFLGDTDFDALHPDAIAFDGRMCVPAAFDAMPDHAGQRGAAAYRTTCDITPGRRGRLRFAAVGIRCRVWVDGQRLADHACGYTPFVIDLPPTDHARREVVVVADNRFDPIHVPLHDPFFDFYQYGGILRSVTLHELPDTWIESVAVSTRDWRTGAIAIRVTLAGEMPTDGVSARFTFDDAPRNAAEPHLIERTHQLTLRVPDARPWNTDDPRLHTLRVSIDCGNASDDYVTRFGLREIRVRGRDILLNDEPIRLVGFNRHEAHPQFGPATPTSLMYADLRMVRACGCNFIRGSHYPQDQRFLDLCDELGIFVWEEMLGWQQGPEQIDRPGFADQHASGIDAMVDASFNHPCVVMWGLLNECHSHLPELRPLLERSTRRLREIGGNRLITYATSRPEEDLHLDLVDVVGVNLYPGWYGCEDADDPLSRVVPGIDRMIDCIDRPPRGLADKPLLISEIGAEALYGWRHPHNDFFTEQYQADYLTTAVRHALASPRLAGILIWHWADCRTYSGGRSLMRPRTYNNKGVLDEYRRPKQAYGALRDLLTSQPASAPIAPR